MSTGLSAEVKGLSWSEAERHILGSQMPPELGLDLPYTGVLERYRDSSWGHHQTAQPPRFSGSFAYGDFITLPNGEQVHEMVEDLGDRVHPVDHNWAAHNDYIGFLMLLAHERTVGQPSRPLEVSPFEVAASRFGIMLHDAGETTHTDLLAICGSVIGDIPHGEKSDLDRAAETKLLETIFDTLFVRASDDMKQYALDIVTHAPNVRETLVHRVYEASHAWGEFDTALTAGRIALAGQREGSQDDLRITQLSRLAKEVSGRVRPILEDEVADFRFVEDLLTANQGDYEQIHREL